MLICTDWMITGIHRGFWSQAVLEKDQITINGLNLQDLKNEAKYFKFHENKTLDTGRWEAQLKKNLAELNNTIET